MRQIAAIIASTVMLIDCSETNTIQENHLLETRLKQETLHVDELNSELKRKNAETERLKADISKRDKTIEALRVQIQFEKADNDDLKEQVKKLNELNLKQKQQLDANLEQLKAIQKNLRQARSDRDFWNEKFHATIHGTARIIERQQKAIDDQKAQLLDIAK